MDKNLLVMYDMGEDGIRGFIVTENSNLGALLKTANGTFVNVNDLTHEQEKAHAYCAIRCADQTKGLEYYADWFEGYKAFFSDQQIESIFNKSSFGLTVCLSLASPVTGILYMGFAD